ncbi:MAG: amidohydrolase family protein [bacterium]
MTEKIIDAYAHIGVPRFGSASDVLGVFDRWNIEKGVLVLGPGIPDLKSLETARDMAGDRIRYMGIPFGESDDQRRELCDIQIKIGISGMRLMPFEIHSNPYIMDRLGEAGLWLFAINPYGDMKMTRVLLDWLEKYPGGKIASPHFLIPETIDQRTDDPALFRELLSHPRFHAILSRHGGVGSQQDYPHLDLKPWVEEIAEIMSWDRLMWGSEFPVMYWRNEQIDTCRDWISNLGVEMSEEDRAKYLGGNAQRLFFDAPAPAHEPVTIPLWVANQYHFEGSIPMFPARQKLPLPMKAHEKILTAYLKANEEDRSLNFADFMAKLLSEKAEEL